MFSGQACSPELASGISVVVPCYNEEAVINALVARLVGVCETLFGANYEILLVNDGSSDRTWSFICAHAAVTPQIIGVDLARNHGHQLALTAGLTLCNGDLVLVIDADLQDPPEILPEMLRKIAEGYDVVYGVRSHRKGETLFKRASAAVFYRLLGKLIAIPIPKDTGDFRLMTRRVVDQLNVMPERFRFIRGMVSWIGFNQTGVSYQRDERLAGETHYTLRRMLAFALDGITGFSTIPLRLASHLGMAFGVLGMAMVVWVIAAYLRHGTVAGWASTITITLVLGSVQLLILGVLGEYLGRMYMETKQRPLFIVREIRSSPKLANAPQTPPADAGRVKNI